MIELDKAVATYFEWLKDWATIEAMAAHHKLTIEELTSIIDAGRMGHCVSIIKYYKSINSFDYLGLGTCNH